MRTDGLVARLAHPLYGEVRRAAMGTLRARRLRGRVAQTLDAAPDPIPRAVLTLDSDLPPDPALFLQAAEAATRMYDLPLAERLAGAAAATGDPVARLVHAGALSWLSRGDEAEAILVDLVESAPDDGTRAMAQLHRTGNLLWTMAQPDEARQALAAAEATGAAPLHVAAMSSVLAAAVGDLPPVLARGSGTAARGSARRPDPHPGRVRGVRGGRRHRDRLSCSTRPRSSVGSPPTGCPPAFPGSGSRTCRCWGTGSPEHRTEADDQARRMRAASADLPGPARLMGLVVAGHAALAGGRVHDALTPAARGVGRAGGLGARVPVPLPHAAGDSPGAGRPGGSRPLLSWPASSPGGTRPTGSSGPTTSWRGRGERPPKDRRREALGHAVAAADLARDAGRPGVRSARLADRGPVRRRDRGAAPADGTRRDRSPRAAVARAHARAWADEDGEALLARPPTPGPGSATSSPPATRQPRRPMCTAGRGGRVLPSSAAALAEKLASRSGARTPALAIAVRPLPLTAREREIVALAARGLSNKDIAARLTVSVRTVEGHLYRAGLKLGVSERTALADLLGVE